LYFRKQLKQEAIFGLFKKKTEVESSDKKYGEANKIMKEIKKTDYKK
jgi:hypothetical protein